MQKRYLRLFLVRDKVLNNSERTKLKVTNIAGWRASYHYNASCINQLLTGTINLWENVRDCIDRKNRQSMKYLLLLAFDEKSDSFINSLSPDINGTIHKNNTFHTIFENWATDWKGGIVSCKYTHTERLPGVVWNVEFRIRKCNCLSDFSTNCEFTIEITVFVVILLLTWINLKNVFNDWFGYDNQSLNQLLHYRSKLGFQRCGLNCQYSIRVRESSLHNLKT